MELLALLDVLLNLKGGHHALAVRALYRFGEIEAELRLLTGLAVAVTQLVKAILIWVGGGGDVGPGAAVFMAGT